MFNARQWWRGTLVALGLASAMPSIAAYPERAVRIVVPFAAGATLDLMTRAVAEELTKDLGQSVVVENRAGASGIIGADAVAKAPPDGYTVLMAPFSVLAVNASLHENLPYDNLRDFAPIGRVAVAPHVLLASTAVPIENLQQLIDYTREHPDELTYASAGAGSSAHLATEVLKHMSGMRIVHVPYKGTAPAYNDLIPGRVAIMVDGAAATLPRIQAGQVRALGVTSAERIPILEDVPTIAEAGVPGYDVTPWYGMVAPAGTPAEVVERLNRALATVLASPALTRRFADMGLIAAPDSPEAFGDYLASETEKWRRVVREAKVTVN